MKSIGYVRYAPVRSIYASYTKDGRIATRGARALTRRRGSRSRREVDHSKGAAEAQPRGISFPHAHVHVIPLPDGDERDRPAAVFTWSNGVYMYEDDEASRPRGDASRGVARDRLRRSRDRVSQLFSVQTYFVSRSALIGGTVQADVVPLSLTPAWSDDAGRPAGTAGLRARARFMRLGMREPGRRQRVVSP